jgi:hypothetical protein
MTELEAVHKHWSPGRWWSTESEKDFIRKIGTFSKARNDRRYDKKERRLKLLISYRASIFERRVWGKIDPKKILMYADALIMEEKERRERCHTTTSVPM